MAGPSPERRYAIYFVPRAETPLYRFGASVLGYDGYAGHGVPFPEGVHPSWPDVVREPSRYGFHATLKAPFRLAECCDEKNLLDAIEEFARSHFSPPHCELDIRELGSFVALVPVRPAPELDALAAACVADFDRYRAPLNGTELARRLASNLTPRQRAHLDRWGYPYVFEDFRFHMTLTGPLAAGDRGEAFRFLCGKIGQEPRIRSLAVDQVVIARQINALAPFSVLHAAPLRVA